QVARAILRARPLHGAGDRQGEGAGRRRLVSPVSRRAAAERRSVGAGLVPARFCRCTAAGRDKPGPYDKIAVTASGGRPSAALLPLTTMGRSMTIGWFTIAAISAASE